MRFDLGESAAKVTTATPLSTARLIGSMKGSDCMGCSRIPLGPLARSCSKEAICLVMSYSGVPEKATSQPIASAACLKPSNTGTQYGCAETITFMMYRSPGSQANLLSAVAEVCTTAVVASAKAATASIFRIDVMGSSLGEPSLGPLVCNKFHYMIFIARDRIDERAALSSRREDVSGGVASHQAPQGCRWRESLRGGVDGGGPPAFQ